MPTADPNVLTVACPGCGAKFRFLMETAGHKTHCGKCGVKFIVPKPRAADEPEYVSVDCRVCQTRLTGRIEQVGQKVKCPDCGAMTVLPPPPPPKPKNMPAALEGEQYELWDADEAPLPSELIARQPKYIALACRNCTTLMYATENQVGRTIACPDCGTTHTVPAPPKRKAKKSVLTRDADTPVLDPAAHPGERPHVVVNESRKMVHEERQEAEYQRALEKSRRTGKPMEIDSRGRPVLPRWPLVSGILPFLFSRGVPVRWLALSVSFYASLSIFVYGLETAMSGGFGAIAGMSFFAIGSILTMLSTAAATNALMAIITESSEGNREIEYWPGFHDWFGDLLVVGVAGMVSALPGFFIAKFAAQNPEQSASAIAASVLLCLPIILMSQLDINSPWGVLSGRVLRSLAKCPFSWLLFYLEIALAAVACGAATYFTAGQNPKAAIWLMPLYVAALILFARLFGRLGWRLAEAMPARE